jgi:hypothetical protein
MQEVASEIGRLDYELGRVAGADRSDPRGRRNRHHHHDPPPSGTPSQDRARHRSRCFAAKLARIGGSDGNTLYRHRRCFGLWWMASRECWSPMERLACEVHAVRKYDVLDRWVGLCDFRCCFGNDSACQSCKVRSNVMLGVKRDNRDSVHGPMKVVLTPNIGLEEFWSLHTPE